MNRLPFAVAVAVALIGCSGEQRPSRQPAVEALPAANLEAGKSLAEQNCRGCHGLDGQGTAPGIPHLASQDERYLLGSLEAYRDGKRMHAALRDMTAGMSEADLRNVVGYYAALPALDAGTAAPGARYLPYERGATLAADCGRCHGRDGNSTTAGMPSLAGQQPHYLVVAVHEYLNGIRTRDPMHSLLRRLSKLDVESVALYFASQAPAQRGAPPFGDPGAGEPLTAVCGGCHGSHGVSTDAATPNLAGQDAQYLTQAIQAYRKTRRHEGMQAYVSELSRQDIENIAAFYSMQKSRPAERGQSLIEDLIAKCERCHGAKVESTVIAVPTIRGQDKDYLIMALRAYRDDRRESSTMHSMSLPYSDSIIESVASFYAGQPEQ
jgi:cytochrome c553